MVLTDAQATLEAARITAEATRCAGWMGLIAGILALCGAIWVGCKQTKITEFQTKINLRSLQFSLYDKRDDVHNKIRKYFLFILGNCKSPDHQTEVDFHYAVRHCKMLFSCELSDRSKNMRKCCLFFLKSNIRTDEDNLDKEMEFYEWLTKELQEIDALFIDEMRIHS